MVEPPPIVRLSSYGQLKIDDDDELEHRGKGILAGDFIKPDPALTQQETRTYLVDELKRWLTGRICLHAKEVAAAFPDPMDLIQDLADGTWPAARLYMVVHMLRIEQGPTTYEDAAEWAVRVCTEYLEGGTPQSPTAIMAAEFVRNDKLPCGRSIQSFWDHTPFDPLRSAAPLSEEAEVEIVEEEEAEVEIVEEEEDSEGEVEEAEVEIVEDSEGEVEEAEVEIVEDSEGDVEEGEAEVEIVEDSEDEDESRSMDETLDTMTLSVSKLLTSDLTFTVPGWVLVTSVGVVVFYVWTVAMALSIAKNC
jgi:hypothetical protein